jgi:hypothetical protein
MMPSAQETKRKYRTRSFSEEQVGNIIESNDEVSTGTWRWGHTKCYVVQDAGRFWKFTVQFHTQEGWQREDVLAYEVEPKQVTKTVWSTVLLKEGEQ